MPKRRVRRHSVVQPLNESYRLIPLTQGQNAIVDADDFEWLSQWNWCASWNDHTKSFYVKRRQGKHLIRMHRAILDCEDSLQCDHVNGDTLDHRRANIRECTNAQNNQNKGPSRHNTSGFKGVCWEARRSKWMARIHINGKEKFIGYFDSPEEGARAYDERAKKLHGRFARLNFF